MSSSNYVDTIYNEDVRPITAYPDKLAKYLVDRYGIKSGSKFLDLGCGRGDFLSGFIKCGVEGYGVDQGLQAQKLCPDADIKAADLANESLPYDDCFFDYIYSKSVIEHFYYPECIVKEIYRVLKPGGLVITLTPDWEVVYKMFYEDYTHRTPFTLTSLTDIYVIHGFECVSVEKFRQLPFLWNMPIFWPLTSLLAWISPDCLKAKSKLVKFSKEMMLLGSAIKPLNRELK